MQGTIVQAGNKIAREKRSIKFLETMAIRIGLQLLENKEEVEIYLETDFLGVERMVKVEETYVTKIFWLVDEICTPMKLKNVTSIRHVKCEANSRGNRQSDLKLGVPMRFNLFLRNLLI